MDLVAMKSMQADTASRSNFLPLSFTSNALIKNAEEKRITAATRFIKKELSVQKNKAAMPANARIDLVMITSKSGPSSLIIKVYIHT